MLRIYCEECEVRVKINVVLKNIYPENIIPVREGGNHGKITISFRTLASLYYKAETEIIEHDGHKLFTTCFECGKKISIMYKNGKIYPENSDIKLLSHGYVCEDCYNRYYRDIEFPPEEEEDY